jgi:sugar phosphate isomerase/epimerase
MPAPEGTGKLAVHTITTRPWSIETAVEKYAAVGVRGISIWIEALEGRDPGRVARQIQDSGLEAVSLVRGGFFPSRLEAGREAAVAENIRLIELAHTLGTPMIVLVCGADPGLSLDESRKQIAEGIFRILPAAQEHGIRLAIEPLHPMYSDTRSAVNTMEQANDICDEIGSPSLGIAVDVYHVWWDSRLGEEIVRAGRNNRIFGFHTCDWKYPVEDILNDRGLMGEGCAPVRQIRMLCEENGFDGYHEVEIFSNRYWAMDQDQYLRKIRTAYLEYA